MRYLMIMAVVGLSSGAALAAGDPAAGQEKAAVCAACHGANGVSESAEFPTLAGQHASYLEVAMQQYKEGSRKNPIMQGQVASLSEQDIEDLAAFFARQKGLYTPQYPKQ